MKTMDQLDVLPPKKRPKFRRTYRGPYTQIKYYAKNKPTGNDNPINKSEGLRKRNGPTKKVRLDVPFTQFFRRR